MTKVWSIYEEDGTGDHRINFFETLDELMGALDELIDYEENLDGLTHYVDLSVLIKELHTIQCASANLNDSLRKWIENYLEKADRERDNLSTEIRLVGKENGQLYLIKREDLQPEDGEVLTDKEYFEGDTTVKGRQYLILVTSNHIEVFDLFNNIKRYVCKLLYPEGTEFHICMDSRNDIPRATFKAYLPGERLDLGVDDSNIWYFEHIFDMLQCTSKKVHNLLKFDSTVNHDIIIFAPTDEEGAEL